MADLIFDKKSCPDLMRVTLQGEGIDEFLRCIDEQEIHFRKWMEIMHRRVPKELQGDLWPTYKAVLEESEEIAGSLRQLLIHMPAGGIHLEELDLRIREAEKEFREEARPRLDSVGPIEADKGASADSIDRKQLHESLLQEFKVAIMQDFCQGVAVQQGREGDYIAMIGAFNDKVHKEWMDAVRGSDTAGKKMILTNMAINILSADHMLKLRKDRESPIAVFMEVAQSGRHNGNKAANYGDHDIFRKCIEVGYGLDLIGKEADRQSLRRFVDEHYTAAAGILKVDKPIAIGSLGV